MKLKPYQEAGGRWLANRTRALLADEQRVGKTPQAIYACDLLDLRKILVTCPRIAVEDWGRAFDTWSLFGRPQTLIVDNDMAVPGGDGVTVVSHDTSRVDRVFDRILSQKWDVLIVDEAQYLKEPKSQRTKRVLSAKGWAAKATRIWFLTGTPILTHPAEAWIILRTCGAYTGSYSQFVAEFCITEETIYGTKIVGTRNELEWHRRLNSIMLRRTYDEVNPGEAKPRWIDVPLNTADAHPEDTRRWVEGERSERYGAHLRKALDRIAAGEEIDLMDVRPKQNMARLRWFASWVKIAPATTWLREMLLTEAIDKCVVFAHHGRVIELLEENLRLEFGAAAIYGQTKQSTRDDRLRRFRDHAKRRVLILQDVIGRTALDLSVANVVVFVELDWVVKNNEQALMRVRGPNQKRLVTIYNLVLTGSIDGAVQQVVARRTKRLAKLLG